MSKGADPELIYEALRFFFWAAGQGISPNADQDAGEPEECFWQYCLRTDDENWETVAERYRAASTIEARSGETRTRLDPKDESVAPQGETQNPMNYQENHSHG